MGFGYDDSPKRKRAKKVPRDPNAPKKPSNAFLIFGTEIHRSIQKNARFGLRVSETYSHAGDLWRRMTEAKKLKYVEMAKADKIRYQKELAEYLKKKDEAVDENKETDEGAAAVDK